MKTSTKALAAIMLIAVAIFFVGCQPENDPNNGGGNNSGGNGVYNGHEYVDLGLPSGLLWATCNVGADKPEEYGDYFAWGETAPKAIYNLTTCFFCNDDQFIKYCSNSSYGYNGFTDTLTILQPSDDAATANWGSGWCMPTADQWRELKDNTITQWATQNGIDGLLLIAPNGNSLFLPAAGYRWNDELYYVGLGTYWSCLLNTDYPSDAWFFDFNSNYCNMGNSGRDRGRSVRAVHPAPQNQP